MKARAGQVGDLNCTILKSRDTEKDSILLAQRWKPLSHTVRGMPLVLFYIYSYLLQYRKEKGNVFLLFSETVFLCVVLSVLKLSL